MAEQNGAVLRRAAQAAAGEAVPLHFLKHDADPWAMVMALAKSYRTSAAARSSRVDDARQLIAAANKVAEHLRFVGACAGNDSGVWNLSSDAVGLTISGICQQLIHEVDALANRSRGILQDHAKGEQNELAVFLTADFEESRKRT